MNLYLYIYTYRYMCVWEGAEELLEMQQNEISGEVGINGFFCLF